MDFPQPFDLSALIAPIAPEAFFAEHWERKPLLLQQRGPAYYQSLVTIDALEDFISGADARYPAIRLAKGGGFFPPEAYTRDVKYGDEFFRGVPDVERILAEYSTGATVTLPALHLSLPAIGRLCRQLQAQLDHSVHTNAYLTPPGTPGFTPHYDTHEVFVLQIAGHKQWRVYSPPIALPHLSQPFSPEHYQLPATPLMQFELQAGDLLYLPRGHVHTTNTSAHFSAHVTIGVTVYTWVELLAELFQASAAQPQLRAALPPGFAHRPEVRSELEQRFGPMLETLVRGTDVAALTARFLQRVRSSQPRAEVRFHADPAALIGPDTTLRVAAGFILRTQQEHGELLLDARGRRIRLQSAVGPALQAMRDSATFSAQSLPANINLEARLQLVRYLQGIGLLELIG
ncbi:MAG TPA: cupin domain-containing protein [Steroidobacteraceae bacterium]|nr:cupin domain-containing protein [Steroidobacteraceae bacterium]